MSNAIFEIHKLSQILPYIKGSSLVLLDIDDTLVQASTYLGSKEWVRILRTVLPSLKKEPLTESLIWHILPQVPFAFIESASAHLIQCIQNQYSSTTLGFTARPLVPYKKQDLTIDLLQNLNIHFERSNNTDVFHTISEYKDGVIFTNGIGKGFFLNSILDQIKPKFPSMIFVDDRIEQIQSVSDILERHDVKHYCFLYKHLENTPKLFDETACAVQMHYLLNKQQLLSNSIACKLKGSNPQNIIDQIKHLIKKYENSTLKK